jgi:hypothetical protein
MLMVSPNAIVCPQNLRGPALPERQSAFHIPGAAF